jgi:hypothetical protein
MQIIWCICIIWYIQYILNKNDGWQQILAFCICEMILKTNIDQYHKSYRNVNTGNGECLHNRFHCRLVFKAYRHTLDVKDMWNQVTYLQSDTCVPELDQNWKEVVFEHRMKNLRSAEN